METGYAVQALDNGCYRITNPVTGDSGAYNAAGDYLIGGLRVSRSLALECIVASDRVRATAADWHGGQSSPLYALASTGTVLPGAADEVRYCLAELDAGIGSDDENGAARARLLALLDYVAGAL